MAVNRSSLLSLTKWARNHRDQMLTWNRKRTIGLSLILAGVSLLFFYIPILPVDGDLPFNQILQYCLITIFAFSIAKFFKVPTLQYLNWPVQRWQTYFGIGMSLTLIFGLSVQDEDQKLAATPLITGILYIFVIGLGEEFVDRLLVLGLLLRFGTKFAVVVSSFIFGLSHLNVYVYDWGTWDAITHVFSAFGVGLFLAALMVVTKSIWVSIIVHAMIDWSVIFETIDTETLEPYSPGILEGISWCLFDFTFPYGFCAYLLYLAHRGKWPKPILRLIARIRRLSVPRFMISG